MRSYTECQPKDNADEPEYPDTCRNCMSIVVSETSSSLRGTSMGPLIETSALVAPVVHSAEPSARLNGFVAMLSESCIASAV